MAVGVVKPTGVDIATNEIRETKRGYVSYAVQTGSNDNTALADAVAALPTDGGVIELGKGNVYLDNFKLADGSVNGIRLVGVGASPTGATGTVIKPSNTSSGNPTVFASGSFRTPAIENLTIDNSGSATNPCLRVGGVSSASGLGFTARNCCFLNTSNMSSVSGRNGALTELDGTSSWSEIIADFYSCIWNQGTASTNSNMYIRTTNLQLNFFGRKMLMGVGGLNIDCEASGWIKCIGRYCAANSSSYSQTNEGSTYKSGLSVTLTNGSRVVTASTPIFGLEDTSHVFAGSNVPSGTYIKKVVDSKTIWLSAAATGSASGTYSITRNILNASNLGAADIYLRGAHTTVSMDGGSDEGILDLFRINSGQFGGIINMNGVYSAGRFNMIAGQALLNSVGSDLYNGFIYSQGGTLYANFNPGTLGGYNGSSIGPGSTTLATGKVEKPVPISRLSGAVIIDDYHAWIQDFNADSSTSVMRPVRQWSLPTTQYLDPSQTAPTNPNNGAISSQVHYQSNKVLRRWGQVGVADPENEFFGPCELRDGTDGWGIIGHSQDADFTASSSFQLGLRNKGAFENRDYLSTQTCYIFTITSGTASNGATYSNNGQTFTVRVTISGETTLICVGTGSPSSSGTLTKTSGTGDASITFSTYSKTFGFIASSVGPQFNILEPKNPLADTDKFVVQDSAAGRLSKGFTWGNLKTALTTYFGTTYALLAGSISQAFSVLTLDIGNTDTTLSRASAGDVNIEGNLIYRAGGTDVPLTDGGTGASTASAARTNLGLGTAATQNSTAFLQPGNNLSDVGSASTSRTNLGLGTAATQASSAFLQPGNNLGDVSSAATARTNLALGAGNTPSFKGVRATDVDATNGGVGYPASVGVGANDTQSTSRSTGFTSNHMCGLINGRSDSLAAGARATFTVTTSAINNTDNVILTVERAGDVAFGTDPPQSIHWVSDINNGSFSITIWNTSGSADTYAYYYRWSIIKSAFD